MENLKHSYRMNSYVHLISIEIWFQKGDAISGFVIKSTIFAEHAEKGEYSQRVKLILL